MTVVLQRYKEPPFLSSFLISFYPSWFILSLCLLSSSLFSLSFLLVLRYVGPLPRSLTTKCRITLSSSTKLIFHRMWKKLVDLIFSFSCVRKNCKGWEGVKDAISVHTSSQNPCGCCFANVWCKKNSTPLFNTDQQDLTPNCAVPCTYGFYMSLYFILTVPEFGSPSGPGPTHYPGFTITLWHTTLGRTPPDERSARRRDPYLTTHNTHKRQAYSRQDSNHITSRRAAADPRLRPHGHWDRRFFWLRQV
jgi:hypothetical protein